MSFFSYFKSYIVKFWRYLTGQPLNRKAERRAKAATLRAKIDADLKSESAPFNWSDESEKLHVVAPHAKTPKVPKIKTESRVRKTVDSQGTPVVILKIGGIDKSFRMCEHGWAIRPRAPCLRCTVKPCVHKWHATKDKPCLRCAGTACEHNWVSINGSKCGVCSYNEEKKGLKSPATKIASDLGAKNSLVAPIPQKLPTTEDFPPLGNKFAVLQEESI